MDELPSTRFRNAFPRLTSTTTVTANGHVIGTWTPASVHVAVSTMTDARALDAIRPGEPASTQQFAADGGTAIMQMEAEIKHLKQELARRDMPNRTVETRPMEPESIGRAGPGNFGFPSPAPKTRKAR